MGDNGTNHGSSFGPFERNRYFYGKLMTVRDFDSEQRYFNAKRQLLNRLIHGVGMVRGLEVATLDFDKEQLQAGFRAGGGCALDCCGQEIVVPEQFADAVPVLLIGSKPESVALRSNLTKGGVYYLFIRHKDSPCERVPAIVNPSGCGEETCCHNKIREQFELVLGTEAPPDHEAWVNPVNWNDAWSKSNPEIKALAEKIWEERKGKIWQGIDFNKDTDLTDWNDAKLLFSVRESLKFLEAPASSGCHDPKVLLTVAEFDGQQFTFSHAETAKHRQRVYSNPLLHELLRSHLVDFENPHNLTATQVDHTGGEDMLVKQINAGTGVINESRLDSSLARDAELKAHTDRKDNPHSVTAKQVDETGGANRIVEQINAGNGVISGWHIDDSLARDAELKVHTDRKDNPHYVTAKQVDEAGGANRIVEQINAGSGVISGWHIDDSLARDAELKVHIDRKDNPHQVKHEQTFPVGWDGQPGETSKRNRHLSDVDAAKWNSALLKINNLSANPATGNFTVQAENGIAVSSTGANSLTLSLTKPIFMQLQTVFASLRQQALQLVAITFREVSIQSGSAIAREIALTGKAMVDKKAYADEADFASAIEQLLEMMNNLSTSSTEIVTEASLKLFISSIEELANAKKDKQPLAMAAALGDVCFYAGFLEKKPPLNSHLTQGVLDQLKETLPKLSDGLRESLTLDDNAKILNTIFEKPGETITQLAAATQLSQPAVKAFVEQATPVLLTKSGSGYKLIGS